MLKGFIANMKSDSHVCISNVVEVSSWRHQAITWTDVDFSSVKSYGIHTRAISREYTCRVVSTLLATRLVLQMRAPLPASLELAGQ